MFTGSVINAAQAASSWGISPLDGLCNEVNHEIALSQQLDVVAIVLHL
jgi:hypothetical protein